MKINGAVLHSNTVGYVAGKKVSYYIDQAGGFASDAKKRQTYILYMNGSVARVGHDAKVEPGCEIFVPTKAQSNGKNFRRSGSKRRQPPLLKANPKTR